MAAKYEIDILITIPGNQGPRRITASCHHDVLCPCALWCTSADRAEPRRKASAAWGDRRVCYRHRVLTAQASSGTGKGTGKAHIAPCHPLTRHRSPIMSTRGLVSLEMGTPGFMAGLRPAHAACKLPMLLRTDLRRAGAVPRWRTLLCWGPGATERGSFTSCALVRCSRPAVPHCQVARLADRRAVCPGGHGRSPSSGARASAA